MPASFVDQQVAALGQAGSVDQEFVAAIKKAYGLDTSILQGYFNWLGNVCKLDFGNSFLSHRPVLDEIFNADRLGTSFVVAAIATVFEFLIAIPLGITAATHQYSVRDYTVTVFVLIGISLPSFFFGQLLKDVFANKLGWFPISGMSTPGVTLGGFAQFDKSRKTGYDGYHSITEGVFINNFAFG